MKWDTIQAIRVPHQVRNHNHTSNQSTTPCTTPGSKPHSGNPTAWQKIGGKHQSIWPIEHRDLWRSTIVYHLEGAQYIIQSNIMLVILFTANLGPGYQACLRWVFFFFSNASVSQQSLQIAITSLMQPEASQANFCNNAKNWFSVGSYDHDVPFLFDRRFWGSQSQYFASQLWFQHWECCQ